MREAVTCPAGVEHDIDSLEPPSHLQDGDWEMSLRGRNRVPELQVTIPRWHGTLGNSFDIPMKNHYLLFLRDFTCCHILVRSNLWYKTFWHEQSLTNDLKHNQQKQQKKKKWIPDQEKCFQTAIYIYYDGKKFIFEIFVFQSFFFVCVCLNLTNSYLCKHSHDSFAFYDLWKIYSFYIDLVSIEYNVHREYHTFCSFISILILTLSRQ